MSLAEVIRQEEGRFLGFADSLRPSRLVPVDVDALLSKLGVKFEVRIAERGIKGSYGFLLRGGRTATVVVVRDARARGTLTARERFTVAHELGHLVWDRRVGLQPTGRTDYWKLEGVCNRFAANLLVPTDFLLDDSNAPPSGPLDILSWVRRLANRLQVSLEVLGGRLVDCYPNLVLGELELPTMATPKMIARVRWLCQSSPVFAANRGRYITPGHPLARLAMDHAISSIGEVKRHDLDSRVALVTLATPWSLLIAGHVSPKPKVACNWTADDMVDRQSCCSASSSSM
jgi:hypothetical protein